MMYSPKKYTEIQLRPSQIHQGNLILVNGQFPLLRQERPRLTPMEGCGQGQEPTVFLESTAASILRSILQAVRANGSIVPVSGYRNFLHQRKIYEDSLKESGAEFTMKYVALPGCSEHQTGLAIDLGLVQDPQDAIDYICPEFPYDGICQKFRQNAPSYGFIERYKADKTHITGIAAEPWHFRYVGYPHAAIMEERGFSLEEYIDFLRGYPYEGDHLQVSVPAAPGVRCSSAMSTSFSARNSARNNARNSSGKNNGSGSNTGNGAATSGSGNFEIFFVSLREGGAAKPAVISLPSDKIYQISGNNDDGCIVTVWS